MRFLVAEPGPNFAVQDIHNGWCEVLRALGHHVVEFNLSARLTFYGSVLMEAGEGTFRRALDGEAASLLSIQGLYSELYKFRPNVLIVVSGFFIPGQMLDHIRDTGTKVVILHTESPYEDQRQSELAWHADINIVDDPTNLSLFPPGTIYLPKAYRPSIHHPGPAVDDLRCDFAFVGTGFPSRIAFFEAMDLSGLDVLLAGNWASLADDSPLRKHVAHDLEDCLNNTDAADIYRSAKVGLNLYRREAQTEHLSVGYSMGPREVEMAACGLFFLRDPRPEGDEVLPMLPTFTSPQDAAEQLRWWLGHDDERTKAAGKARQAVAGRTFTEHARQLLRLLDPR